MPNLFTLPRPSSNGTPLRSQYDASVREQQNSDPDWKKKGRSLIDVLANIPKGMLGIDPAQDESNAGYVTNALTQLGSNGSEAALPFVGMKPLRTMAHNTFGMTNDLNQIDRSANSSKGMLQQLYDVESNPEARRKMLLAKFDSSLPSK